VFIIGDAEQVEGLLHTDRPFSIMCLVPVKSISRYENIYVGSCVLNKQSALLNVDRLETNPLRSLNHFIARNSC